MVYKASGRFGESLVGSGKQVSAVFQQPVAREVCEGPQSFVFEIFTHAHVFDKTDK